MGKQKIDWQYFFGGRAGGRIDRYYKADIYGVRVECHSTRKASKYSIGNIDKAKVKYNSEAELLKAVKENSKIKSDASANS